ncbi:MAG: family 78 glycoside hydrolase catalytic domain [Planctomycetota bacterium]
MTLPSIFQRGGIDRFLRCALFLLLSAAPLSAQISGSATLDGRSAAAGGRDSVTYPPTELLVEYQPEPCGIQTTAPRFSWVLQNPVRGHRQTAFRILVSSSVFVLGLGIGDLWDSGKAQSGQSTNVEYAGPPLAGSRKYFWKVMVWDQTDTPGPWSLNQTLGTGVFPGHWTAEQIWDGTVGGNNYCYLRHRFDLPKQVVLARLHVSAHDDYELYVNGQYVGKGPAQSDPYDRQLYNTYDVADLLGTGSNTIAALAHYHGAGAGCGVLGTPAFILQMHVKFVDQSTTTVVTDASWKVRPVTPYGELAPFRGPSFAMATAAEWYDARSEEPGWQTNAFNDSHWQSAAVVQPGYNLVAQECAQEEVERVLTPGMVVQPAAGVSLVDFGENISGHIRLVIRDPYEDQTITVWYSEEMENGRIVRDRDGITDYHDQYICSGNPLQIWEPDIKYNGFRYVEVEGYPGPVSPADITASYVHTSVNPRSQCETSSSRWNSIFDISVRTQKNSMQGILADCPQREQTQYAADALIQGHNVAYNFNNPGLLRKYVYDLWGSNLGGAIILDKHPSMTGQIVPESSLLWPVGLWNQYLYYDDLRLLQEMYPNLQAMVSTFDLFRNGSTNLLTSVPGVSIADAPVDIIDHSGAALTIQNCLYYQTLRIAADIADVLGNAAEATAYRNVADLVKGGINSHLFNGVDRYFDCSGSAQAHSLASVLPLYVGIVPAAQEQAVLDRVKSLGFEPSVQGGFYLIETLYKHDEGQFAYDLVNQSSTRWAKMVNAGATTCWEWWEPNLSRSHGRTAYPMKFFKSGLVGVEPTSPGFGTFRVRPHIGGGLTYAQCDIPTIKGSVGSRWKKVATGLQMSVHVPVNTVAEVHVPALAWNLPYIKDGDTTIWNNGTYLGGTSGVTYVGVDGEYVIFNLQSGLYYLEVVGS